MRASWMRVGWLRAQGHGGTAGVCLVAVAVAAALLSGPAPARANEGIRADFLCKGCFDASRVTAFFFNEAPSAVVLVVGETARRPPPISGGAHAEALHEGVQGHGAAAALPAEALGVAAPAAEGGAMGAQLDQVAVAGQHAVGVGLGRTQGRQRSKHLQQFVELAGGAVVIAQGRPEQTSDPLGKAILCQPPVVLARMLHVHQRDQGGAGTGHGARALPISSALGVSTSSRKGRGMSCHNGCEGRWLTCDACDVLGCCHRDGKCVWEMNRPFEFVHEVNGSRSAEIP